MCHCGAPPHLEGSVGQKGESVLLEEALTGVHEDRVSNSLSEGEDVHCHIFISWSLL